MPKHIRHFKSQLCIVGLLLNLACVQKMASFNSMRNILPLGDSITQGEVGHNSYRRALWKMLDSAAYKIDFVGSMRTNFGGFPPDNDFDLDHEGHYGWRADQIADSLPSWLKNYTPDIVLLHIGTNDIFQKKSVENTIKDIGRIISDLRNANPHVAILLARIIPHSCQCGVESFNAALPGLADSLMSSISPIVIVDQYSGFSIESDLYDGAHPNVSGEIKMAKKWFAALESFLR